MPATGVLRAGPDVGGGACDRAGRGEAADERRDDVGDPLRHQLDIRIVAIAAHAIRDGRRHERFDRRQASPRSSRASSGRRADRQRNSGQMKRRQAGGYAAEPAADRLDVQAKRHDRRRRDQRARRSMPGSAATRVASTDACERERRTTRSPAGDHVPAEAMSSAHARHELARDRDRCCRPKKSRICVLAMRTAIPLVKPTTTGRGMKRTADPDAGYAERDQHDAGHDRAHEQAVDAVLGDDAGDDDDERAGRAADLHARAAERARSGSRRRSRCRCRPAGTSPTRSRTPSRAAARRGRPSRRRARRRRTCATCNGAGMRSRAAEEDRSTPGAASMHYIAI